MRRRTRVRSPAGALTLRVQSLSSPFKDSGLSFLGSKVEIHDFDRKIKRCREIIAGLRNGEVAFRMLDHLVALGLSAAAVSKCATHLIPTLRLIDFDVEKATRSDVERVVAKINSSRWKEWTKRERRMTLRRLIQYAKYRSCERGAPVPPEVGWIKLTVKDKDSRVTPEALLTREDFEALVKAADNARDKAMLYTLFEGALRPSELLSMNIGGVEFRDNHCLMTVNGKTGLKRLPLVVSFKPILEWVEQHPKRADQNAPLWCSLATNYKGERLSYRHFRLIIRRIAKKAGLKKAVWPYLFRHSTLTALAKVFTEARLEQYAGWVHGSKMAARYVHFSARDLEDAVLELHGLKAPGEATDVPRLVECPRCSRKNPPGNVRCGFCGFILDKELAVKMEEEERKKDEVLLRLAKEIDEIKSALAALIASQQGGIQQPPATSQPSLANPQAPSSGQQRTLQTHASPENMVL